MTIVDKNRFRFENETTFETRAEEARKILEKYPTRVPVVCEWLPKTKSVFLPPLEKKKFLVPNNMCIGQFRGVINRQLDLNDSSISLYFTMKDNKSPSSVTTLQDLYSRKKSPDGFLYINFSEEATFGWQKGLEMWWESSMRAFYFWLRYTKSNRIQLHFCRWCEFIITLSPPRRKHNRGIMCVCISQERERDILCVGMCKCVCTPVHIST